MKKIISTLALTAMTLLSVSSAFAGEYDATNKIEQTGGFLQMWTIAIQVPSAAVSATTNLVSKEVSGMTPTYDAQKYAVDGKFVKLSLQDNAGKEVKFATGVTIVFNNIKDTFKDPVILFNANNTVTELTGSYTPEVKSISLENVSDVNGVFIVADRLVGGTSTVTSTAPSASGSTDTLSPTGVTSLLGTSTDSGSALNASASGTALNAGSENVQDRVKGSNVYVLLLAALLAISLGGALVYRKV